MDTKRNILFKRVKERTVWEAKLRVDEWRTLFKEGEIDQFGKWRKLTLKQAAERVGIPKKTLEDYHQLLRKASQVVDLECLKDKKMGYLRELIKQTRVQEYDNYEYEEDEQDEEYEEDRDMENYNIQQKLYQDVEMEDEYINSMIVEGDIQQYWLQGMEALPLRIVQFMVEPQTKLPHDKFIEIDQDEIHCDSETDDDFE